MAPLKQRELILGLEASLKKDKIGVWEWSDEEEDDEMTEDLDND